MQSSLGKEPSSGKGKKKKGHARVSLFLARSSHFSEKKAQLLLQLTPHQLETLSGKKYLKLMLGGILGLERGQTPFETGL